MRHCSVGGCERKHDSRGYCGMHNMRIKRTGSAGSIESARYGQTKHPLYHIWTDMRERCRNPKRHNYKNYGGRGIKVCGRWNDFRNFVADMGPKPSPNHSLDRIDVNGNYEPSNCRWATIHQQNANQRSNNNVVGVSWRNDMGCWVAHLQVDKKWVLYKRFVNKSDAIAARKEAEQQFLKPSPASYS